MKNLQRILKKDPHLKNEITGLIEAGRNLPIAIRNNVNREAIAKALSGPATELPRARAMILLHLRPALLIKNDKIQMPESAEMRNRIKPYVKKIEHCIPSIGRIEFLRSNRKYGGTGWMISEDIIVTNRHVAELVAEKKGKSYIFKKNAIGDSIQALIDFKEEYIGENIAAPEFEVEIEKVLYMTEDKKTLPDLAFLKVKKNPDLPRPIPVTDKKVTEDQFISVIGYPAYDPMGIISRTAAKDVFGNIYDVKRCAPGEVKEDVAGSWYFFHDCTTLGGNSGSVVLDNETGVAVGLHFLGEVEKENYAVKGSEIIKHFLKVSPKYMFVSGAAKPEPVEKESAPVAEAAPETYDDREGFDRAFLGRNKTVDLPTVTKNKTQVLSFDNNGKKTFELKYHHFSVVMNKNRRQCFFSACNIDGKQSKRGVARTTWKFDPRIPKELQIKEECYGGPPKFSRGHMTRKEDPIWGELDMAKAAGSDTFHVTNATPQMQPFNAPVWLALENYALENARQDDMKICVITGPIFANDDPTKYGVKIPVDFFKIIAFIHDKTKKLCATGYTISQADYLKNEEFVFGEFDTFQVSIKSLETRTGLSFGNLTKVDPFKGEEAAGAALSSVDEVRFI